MFFQFFWKIEEKFAVLKCHTQPGNARIAELGV